jgi:Domain of unknown function (DUF4105)
LKFLIVLFCLLPCVLAAQNDSCHLRISLLTCTPGEELYSTFGHSALRITDSVSRSDIVYNYGTFNFDEPGFYTKFIRGKLTFYLSTDEYDSFLASYAEEKRGITEQVLQLTCAEKYNMLLLLQANMMEQNRFYKYDFTFDNCTTRLRDLLEKATTEPVHFGGLLQYKATFRDLIYKYLDYNDKQWSKLGIDILLGSPLDVTMKPREVMFLPDYLMSTLDKTSIGNRPLVSEKHTSLPSVLPPEEINIFTHPLFIFCCLLVLVIALSFSKNAFIRRLLVAFDGFLFFMTGLLGILLLFMWFGTDHVMCRNNYNLLWAWPLNVIAAFYIDSKKNTALAYLRIYAFFNLAVLVCWFLLPQHLNPSLMPVIALMIFRVFWHVYRKNKANEAAHFSA